MATWSAAVRWNDLRGAWQLVISEIPYQLAKGKLIEQIAAESGAKVGGTLYSDALASEGPASTYLGMFQHNLDTLLAALEP